MRKSLSLLILLLVIFGVTACKSQKNQIKTPVPAGDNSLTSLDWDGIYQGILPCADCPGIKIQIVLNKDLTYKVKTSYLERGTGIEAKGHFSWNEEGNIIILDSNYNQKYQVGENRLFSLDGEGKRITGDLADQFILEKEKPELTGKNWILITLNDKPVKSEAKQPFMVFNQEGKRISGNTGCNNFFGTYELSGDNAINFSPLGMTKMACFGENPEQEFAQILEKATNYLVTIDMLILKDENGNSLANFESDFFLL